MAVTAPIENHCLNCNKSETETGPLKQCVRCKSARYCSRDCQKADWKKHKKNCANLAQAAGETPSAQGTGRSNSNDNNATSPLEFQLEKPFTQLYAKKWLHGRPETDVYKLLIDTYRLRMEDNYSFTGDVDEDSIYSGRASGVVGFQRFLRLIEREGRELLPDWWSPAKAKECVALGSGRDKDYNLSHAVEKSDIIEQYGEPLMPMQLRMLGEQIYGSGPTGSSGASMLRMQMEAENGSSARHDTLDMSQILKNFPGFSL